MDAEEVVPRTPNRCGDDHHCQEQFPHPQQYALVRAITSSGVFDGRLIIDRFYIAM